MMRANVMTRPPTVSQLVLVLSGVLVGLILANFLPLSLTPTRVVSIGGSDQQHHQQRQQQKHLDDPEVQQQQQQQQQQEQEQQLGQKQQLDQNSDESEAPQPPKKPKSFSSYSPHDSIVPERLFDCCSAASHCQFNLLDAVHTMAASNVTWASAQDKKAKEAPDHINNNNPSHPCNKLPFAKAHLKGYPKTGTGWTVCLAEGMLKAYCERTPQCAHRISGRHLLLEFWQDSIEGSKMTAEEREKPLCSLSWSYKARHEFASLMQGDDLDRVLNFNINDYEPTKYFFAPPDEDTGFVYTIRDPRDVAVSIGFWRTNITEDKDLDRHVIKFFPKQSEAMGLYYYKYMSAGALPMQYESLRLQPLVEMRRLSLFFGMGDLSDGDLSPVIHQCSFNSTQKTQNASAITGVTGMHARSGSVGAYKQHLSSRAITVVEDAMIQNLPNSFVDCYLSKRSRTLVDGADRVDYTGSVCNFNYPTADELRAFVKEKKWTWDPTPVSKEDE
eukprot:TRINITY_DN907_c0_g1_i2.p1 TRINITY_DN907_c0_g1~~TRINITY_DN907_c0_g1_i2.p1  ORF type:complete len:500 (+),score=130.12 TRINITY_DN907_c0_g1_i2:206-1705(+)